MFTKIDTDAKPITTTQMRAFLSTAWGSLGERVADHWELFNDQFFAGGLKPCPICLTPTSPHGHWLGLTCGSKHSHRASVIYITIPRMGRELVADKGVLLHEMTHAALLQRGDDPKHNSRPWCDEITRISRIAGKTIVAVPERVMKVKDQSRPSGRRSARKTEPGALTRADLAHWPHSIGLKLGKL